MVKRKLILSDRRPRKWVSILIKKGEEKGEPTKDD